MLEISGMRHTNNPAKTNANIFNYNKINILQTTILLSDNSKSVHTNPTLDVFNGLDNIIRVVHKCHYLIDDIEAWIVIDYITGDIKITGDNVANILTLFDDPTKAVQSLDDLIDSYQKKPEPNIAINKKDKKKKKSKEEDLWI